MNWTAVESFLKMCSTIGVVSVPITLLMWWVLSKMEVMTE